MNQTTFIISFRQSTVPSISGPGGRPLGGVGGDDDGGEMGNDDGDGGGSGGGGGGRGVETTAPDSSQLVRRGALVPPKMESEDHDLDMCPPTPTPATAGAAATVNSIG